MKALIISLLLVIITAAPSLSDDYIRIDADSALADTTVCPKECLPPVLTNKPPDDVLVANNCNGLTYLFQADPGGVGGNGVVYWDSCLGLGSIDSVTGLYTLNGGNPPGYYQMLIRAVNDCSPPKADSCLFYVRAETEKEVAKKERDGLPTNPLLRSRYVYGPENAESVGVLIETDGSTAELDAMGIGLHARHRENTFTASLTIQQYVQVKKLKSVIHVTAMRRGGDVSWSFKVQSSPESPDLDTSTAYFFADSARALYGDDSTAMSTEADRKESVKEVRDGLPTHPVLRRRYVFGPENAESVGVWIEVSGNTAELESLGIHFFSTSRENIYSARMSVQQYVEVKSLKSVVRVTPMSRGSRAWSATSLLSPQSPDLDTSTAYFFADSARAETGRSTSKKEPDGLPTMPVLRSRYVFGPEDAESVGVYIRVSGSTAPLEALGIKVGSPRLTNVYTATISVKQYTELLKLKPEIVVTLMTRGGGKSWSTDIQAK